MSTCPVKFDTVGRLRSLLISIVDVTTEAIMSDKFGLRAQILHTTEVVSESDVALLVSQDTLASGDHLWCVGELLAVQNEHLAVLVHGTLCQVALVLGCVHLGDRSVKVLNSSRQILINVILVGTDLFVLGPDLRL